MKKNRPHLLLYCPAFLLCLFLRIAFSQDAFMRDDVLDTGIEPNTSTISPWNSPDIWIRQNPDPNWEPYPFPTASPTWTPQAHENPEYRERDYAQPNYVYVRVTNRGTQATSPNDRLRVYWAKASTGLNWPDNWIGAPGNTDADTSYVLCNGVWRVYGKEITKPRKKASTATVAEQQIFADAVAALDTIIHPGSSQSYFALNDIIHSSGHAQHFNDAFVAWHREFTNRYEQMLLNIDPRLTFLYWDWHENPGSGGYDFMGNWGSTSSTAGPAVPIGSPFNFIFPAITRGPFNNVLQTYLKPDATVLQANTYGNLAWIPGGGFPGSSTLSGDVQTNPHNPAHVTHGNAWTPPNNWGPYSGANLGGGFGDASEDPFFFFLHGNVDRLWAQWQRDQSLTGYSLNRLDAATVYSGANNQSGTGFDPGLTELNGTIGPWDGVIASAPGFGVAASNTIAPWTPAGGYINAKPYAHASVVSPPIYDTAPLSVPVLQPGESVIVQIPWYPPNPNEFDCFPVGQRGHFCLLARIETQTNAPFGMTFPEVSSITQNTRNNNNIVWKNVTVVDDFAGSAIMAPIGGIIVRNLSPILQDRVSFATLRFNLSDLNGRPVKFGGFGKMTVNIPREFFGRWVEAGSKGEGIRVLDDKGTVEILTPRAQMLNIPMNPGDFFGVTSEFELTGTWRNLRDRRFQLEVQQVQNDEIVGGNTHSIDFNQIRLVKTGSKWAFNDSGEAPPRGWNSLDFDDSNWKVGNGDFGYEPGDSQANFGTRIRTYNDLRNRGEKPNGQVELFDRYSQRVTTYFRKEFQSAGARSYQKLILRAKSDDGLAVYLNGKEIPESRYCLRGDVVKHDTFATESVEGAQEDFFRTYDISQHLNLLRPGKNVIAAELHQAEESYDAAFDLELFADEVPGVDRPPVVAMRLHDSIHCLIGGIMCSAKSRDEGIKVIIDAVDEKQIVATRFFLNGQLMQEVKGDKLEVEFGGRALHDNRNVLRAETVDSAGNVSSVQRTLNIVPNLPPIVKIESPGIRPIVKEGESVNIKVNAEDLDGEVSTVRFFYKSCFTSFAVPPALFAEFNEPPYQATVNNLHAGPQIISIQVVDNEGASVEESFTVLGARVPQLEIRVAPGGGTPFIVWDQKILESAVLQSSNDLVNWTDLPDARSPYQMATDQKLNSNFLRLAYDLNEAIIEPEPDDPIVVRGPDFRVGEGFGIDEAILNQGVRANRVVVAADWQLPDRNGKVQSSEQFLGNPLVMIFYLGQDCLVCLEQLEAIKAGYASFEGSGVNVVAVSPDPVGELAGAQEYPFTLLSDEDRSAARAFGASDEDGESTHAVIIIDSEGKIIQISTSDLPEMDLGRILGTAQGQ